MNRTLKAMASLMLMMVFSIGCNKPDEPNNGGNNNGQNDSIVEPNGGGDVPVVPTIPEGAIKGKFTINSNGKQVYFSRGNLQFQKSNWVWRFALNQWDFIGKDNESNIVGLEEWIDLFGWGTSSWNNGNEYYMPDAYYYYNGNYEEGYGYGPTNGVGYDFDLSGVYGYADWGVYNKITNGGNQPGQWRTLSQYEWQYLFFDRPTNTEARFAFSNVNGVNGLLLFPDDWDGDLFVIDSINTIGNYANNIITASSWRTLENAGVVFLPAAGYRGTLTVYESGHSGQYWSVSHVQWGGAYSVRFYGASSVNPTPTLFVDNEEARFHGLSVRLVCDIE